MTSIQIAQDHIASAKLALTARRYDEVLDLCALLDDEFRAYLTEPMWLDICALLQRIQCDDLAYDRCCDALLKADYYSIALCRQLSALSLKLGRHDQTRALLADLNAKDPGSRNFLMLSLLLGSNPYLSDELKSQLIKLAHTTVDATELQVIFDLSAKNFNDVERGALLSLLLRRIQYVLTKTKQNLISLNLLMSRIYISLNQPKDALLILEKLLTIKSPAILSAFEMAKKMLEIKQGAVIDFEPKVFCIGLSKTGTTSLSAALGLLGYSSAHWDNKVTGAILSERDFFLFDALSDISISYHFEYLFHAYPNAKFIYTQRPVEEWKQSFLKHFRRFQYGDTFDEMRTNAHNIFQSSGISGRILYAKALYFVHETPEAAYQAYDLRVKSFFAQHKSRCLDFNLFNGNAWTSLCDFLNCPIPDKPFPHKNKNLETS
jgi:hypothetical protein